MLSLINPARPFHTASSTDSLPSPATSRQPLSQKPAPADVPAAPLETATLPPSNLEQVLQRVKRQLQESTRPPAPTQIAARAVRSHFSNRPSVRSVVAGLLKEAIDRQYPALNIDIANTSLARPTSGNPLQYHLTPLLDVALGQLAGSAELDFSNQYGAPCKWVNSITGTSLKTPGPAGSQANDLDMQSMELVIRSLGDNLKPAFAKALSQYWNQDAFAAPTQGQPATSRWLWLSDTLNDTLRTAGLKQTGLDELQRQTLDQITRYPDREQRTEVAGDTAAQVFVVDSQLSRGSTTSSLLSPDLLITRKVDGRNLVMHASAAGVVTPYASREDFAKAWEHQLSQSLAFDQLLWTPVEPDGNIFDSQAAIILNQQLKNLEAIPLSGKGGVDELERLFDLVGDPTPWFAGALNPPADRLEALADNLPNWLEQASDAERFAFQRHTLALASSVQRNHERTFLTDIPDIRTYAQQQLDEQLAGKGYSAQDLEVIIKVPVGTLDNGYIEPVKMNLVDMTLENLAGLPKGQMEVRLRGQPVNDGQLAQTLKDLISQVDIGKNYPLLLKQRLLSDTPQARERESLFVEQVPIQLAMQALELKLKGQAGLTSQGYEYVQAVIQPGTGAKLVDGEEISVRPLAFVRRPGAAPDIVDNMFLIEPLDPARGPHILYRPQLAPPLQEFASREALLKSIRQPGPLQQSILAWLPDEKARSVYGNGGFKIPNIAQYSVFNEFDAPPTPAPTTLAVDGYGAAQALRQDLQDGHLMQHLFKANARSLVTLAEDQSISDAQSRWASHKELGWLLINTLLPVLRGPGAMVGWLLQLSSLENDIKYASSSDHEDSSAAMVDLLVNVSTLLSHSGIGKATEPALDTTRFAERPEVSIPLRRLAEDSPIHRPTLIQQAPTGTPEAFFQDASNPFDFSSSNPRHLSPSQQAHIDSFSVPAPAKSVAPIQDGARKGLYDIDNTLHAHIDNRWFRVAWDLDGAFVIDANNKARTGPALRSDDQGHWQIDTGAKLSGGMPKSSSRIQATIDNNAKVINTMLQEYARRTVELQPLQDAAAAADIRVLNTEEDLRQSETRLRTLWGLTNHGERGNEFAAQYQAQRTRTTLLKSLQRTQLSNFKRQADEVCEQRLQMIKHLTPKNPSMDFTKFKELRSQTFEAIAKILRSTCTEYRYAGDEFSHAETGEPLPELIQRIRVNAPGAYAEMVESLVLHVENLERMTASLERYTAVLEDWKNDSPMGKKQAEAFIKNTEQPEDNQLLVANLERLSALRELSIDRSITPQTAQDRYFLKDFNKAELNAVANAHVELQQYDGYTTAERIAVMSSLIDRYKQNLGISQALHDAQSRLVRPFYGERYLESLKQVTNQAQAELADLIREEEQLQPVAQAREKKAQRPKNHRVFNTRDKQTLIGTLRPPQPGQNIAIIDVLDPKTAQPIASYSEHAAEGEWVQIVQGEPLRPAPVPVAKSWAAYRSDANKLMEEQAGLERSIQFQKKKLDDPARRENLNPKDWSDMLENQAQRLEQVAQQAQASHGGKSETAAMVGQWRDAAKQMRQQAITHRCDGYLRQAPKPENIDYLWTHGRVDIGLVLRGKKLKGGDFLTEYAVREKNGPKELWFAHFHYPTPNTPRAAYSAAHLKTPEQRFLTQKDVIAQAGQDNNRIDSIVRTQIKPPLDRKLFLNL